MMILDKKSLGWLSIAEHEETGVSPWVEVFG